MKRLHVHISVEDITQSAKFYSTLFAAEPTVLKPDYAKWMLDDPRVNFAISAHGAKPGLDHLGIQAENTNELQEVVGRLQAANLSASETGEPTCCYAKSEKSWTADPQGVSWETFLTSGESAVYGALDRGLSSVAQNACCAPKVEAKSAPACCGAKGNGAAIVSLA